MTCTTTLSSTCALVYTAPVPKGMVPEKHLWFSGRNPHRKAGFRLAQILGTGAPALALHGFGWGGPTRKDGRTAEPVLRTSRPPAARRKASSGFSASFRSQAMTKPQGTTPTPHHTTEERRAFAALEAANCAALARWYSARGNVKAARRKAVQLLAALAVLEGVQHA